MLVKFCGATTTAEVDAMAASGADLIGLWHHIPGGHADLTLDRLTALSARARTAGPAPVLVTFSADTDTLAAAVHAARIPWIQLHGFQPPGVLRALRAKCPDGLKIAKVLHVRDDTCLEGRLTAAYERAGADCFLFDAVTGDGRVGSTAQRLDDTTVTKLADATGLPFLLAGGLGPDNHGDFPAATAHPRFYGIDVDSAARGDDGLLNEPRATAVTAAWRPGRGADRDTRPATG
ncbi:N-(5'-phosphoribosyl)anthranilate isomerase [Streptomyces sp. NPDC096176]|uniref:phosphoribosylanthranilate isomerase n=1 Tax=Streptomyces sp. NPDC096176 TaxID=3366079 RepID=UPI0038234E13